MNNYTLNSKIKITAFVLSIAFVAYNILLFVLCGFENHKTGFWTSYAFMLLSFVIISITLFLLNTRTIQPKDMLFSLPILKHCAVYIILEFITSSVFMALDTADFPWTICFVTQFIILIVHIILVTSCFFTKKAVENIDTNTKLKTASMLKLRSDFEALTKNINDNDLKNVLTKLTEDIRYSDPVSTYATVEQENQLSELASELKKTALSAQNTKEALELCKSISDLLSNRNLTCKNSK